MFNVNTPGKNLKLNNNIESLSLKVSKYLKNKISNSHAHLLTHSLTQKITHNI